MAYDWAKLWIEMLDDRKTAALPDSSWRRFVECILLAMEKNEGGLLPSVPDMAWRLRVTPETMNDDMTRLALGGLVELVDDGVWKVTNFAKRQAAMPMADRVASFREREKKKRRQPESNVTVTSQKRDGNEGVTKSYTEEKRIDKNRLEEREIARVTADEPAPSKYPTPTPSMTANLHPAVKAMYQVTTYWPGEIAHPVIIEKLGDTPNIKALERAYQLWISRGYNPKNYDGIGEWYKELALDMTWKPPAQSRQGEKKQPTAPAVVMKEIAPGLF